MAIAPPLGSRFPLVRFLFDRHAYSHALKKAHPSPPDAVPLLPARPVRQFLFPTHKPPRGNAARSEPPPYPLPTHTPRPHSLPADKMRAFPPPIVLARLHLASPPTLRARSLIIHISGGRMYPNLFIIVICARLSLRGEKLQIKQFNPCLHCRPHPSEGRQ